MFRWFINRSEIFRVQSGIFPKPGCLFNFRRKPESGNQIGMVCQLFGDVAVQIHGSGNHRLRAHHFANSGDKISFRIISPTTLIAPWISKKMPS
jgi:hypothetical protein